MSVVVLRWRLAWYGLRLGRDHPRVRAMFGRYVAARGGVLTPTAGPEAYIAWRRADGLAGFLNRSERKHWDRTYWSPPTA